MKKGIHNLGLLLAAALVATSAGFAQQPAASPAAIAAPQTTQGTPAAVDSATVPHASATNVSPDYVIGPGDSLEINVWKEPTISGTLPVRPDGMISLPLVGDITAAGMTPMHLGEDITQRLRKFINDPSVTVTVLGVNSKRIFLVGEVSKPGEMPLSPGLTLIQAIASAGGLSPYANAKHIYILRTSAGKQQRIPFNYKKAIKDGDLQGVTLVSGDTIVIP